jgi:hypothetical protein
MDPQITHKSLESHLNDLDQALEWLKSFRIQPSQTRFRAYRTMVSTVLSHRRQGTTDQLPGRVPPENYQMALIQSADLVEVWKYLRRRRGDRFRQKLRSSVTGAANPIDESPLGANARDTLFELSVAAFFRDKKTAVLIGTNKDVILRFGRHTLFAECKRPRGVSGIPRAIEDSTKQLIKYFAAAKHYSSDTLWGFIAVDASLLVNPDHLVLKTPGVDSVGQKMDSELTAFMHEHRDSLEFQRDSRILGILIFLKRLAFDIRGVRYFDCQKVSMFSHGHARPNTPTAFVAEELYQRLVPNPDQT